MLTQEGIDSLKERLVALRTSASDYFKDVRATGHEWASVTTWELKEDAVVRSDALRGEVKGLSGSVAIAARSSAPLMSDADFQELRQNTRQMLAALRLNRYEYRGVARCGFCPHKRRAGERGVLDVAS